MAKDLKANQYSMLPRVARFKSWGDRGWFCAVVIIGWFKTASTRLRPSKDLLIDFHSSERWYFEKYYLVRPQASRSVQVKGRYFMSRWVPLMASAIQLSVQAVDRSRDVPVGCILLDDEGVAIAAGTNEREATGDSTAHAEIVAIRKASLKRGNWNLEDLTLVVTLEPCVMCAGAIRAARIKRVVFGAWDELAGASGSIYDILRDPRLGKPVEVIGGVLEQECAAALTGFFSVRRTQQAKLD
jgi:tRNA(adenine34) deaminase